ncbi:hypothetical protein Micbo1qcDRAFT_156538, partial [Microdochium bolleyi]
MGGTRGARVYVRGTERGGWSNLAEIVYSLAAGRDKEGRWVSLGVREYRGGVWLSRS